MQGQRIGYVRVSSFDQNPERQLEGVQGHCCKVSDEAAFCLIQRPYISKTLLT
ncbi:recombinase family protein, partial [Klebsiella pneumoniae]|nr:recombinase family protein [Klebsiella pneumoniae]MCD9974549.1 recombinase family protein [Klebsiella pneumoniae]